MPKAFSNGLFDTFLNITFKKANYKLSRTSIYEGKMSNKRILSFSGRICRKDYFTGLLILGIVNVIASLVTRSLGSVFQIILSFVFGIIALSYHVRRLHDIGMKGTIAFFPLVTLTLFIPSDYWGVVFDLIQNGIERFIEGTAVHGFTHSLESNFYYGWYQILLAFSFVCLYNRMKMRALDPDSNQNINI